MNIFQQVIAQAIENGVSEQTVILLLLLPLVTSLVAAARYIIGFRGFGIFIPSALAAALYVAGAQAGVIVFLVVLFSATFARWLLRKFKLNIHYLARMAILLWLVSSVTLVLILASPWLGIGQLVVISIFPILILVLLAEEFIGVQTGKSWREAARLMMETIIIAFLGYLVFQSSFLQFAALKYPHWFIVAPVILNLIVGRFTGLRIFEYYRFRKILK